MLNVQKHTENRKVWSCRLKDRRTVEDRSASGNEFHTSGPALDNVRWPEVAYLGFVFLTLTCFFWGVLKKQDGVADVSIEIKILEFLLKCCVTLWLVCLDSFGFPHKYLPV